MRSGYADNLIFQCRAAGLPAPTPEHRFHPVRKWRLDLAWPDRLFYVEVDGGTWVGGRHNRGKGYENDCIKLNAAAVAGWRGLRVTSQMVKDGRALTALEQALRVSSNDYPAHQVCQRCGVIRPCHAHDSVQDDGAAIGVRT